MCMGSRDFTRYVCNIYVYDCRSHSNILLDRYSFATKSLKRVNNCCDIRIIKHLDKAYVMWYA